MAFSWSSADDRSALPNETDEYEKFEARIPCIEFHPKNARRNTTDFGIETLIGLIKIYKADPDLLERSSDTK